MTHYVPYQIAALAIGLGGAAVYSLLTPEANLLVLAVAALSGYVGTFLADIDDETSAGYRIVKRLSRLAAIIVPCIQFFYRPTDLLLAIVLALFMVNRFWVLFSQLVGRGGYTHSLLAAVCLSLGVAGVGYMTAGPEAVLPAFLSSGAGYIFHLLLDDIHNDRLLNPNASVQPALTPLGSGEATELYSILAIGLLSCIALWTL